MNTTMIDLHGMTTEEYGAEVRRRQTRKIWKALTTNTIVWMVIAFTAEIALIKILSKIGGAE